MQNLYKIIQDQIVFLMLRYILALNHHYFTLHAFKSIILYFLIIIAAKFCQNICNGFSFYFHQYKKNVAGKNSQLSLPLQ